MQWVATIMHNLGVRLYRDGRHAAAVEALACAWCASCSVMRVGLSDMSDGQNMQIKDMSTKQGMHMKDMHMKDMSDGKDMQAKGMQARVSLVKVCHIILHTACGCTTSSLRTTCCSYHYIIPAHYLSYHYVILAHHLSYIPPVIPPRMLCVGVKPCVNAYKHMHNAHLCCMWCCVQQQYWTRMLRDGGMGMVVCVGTRRGGLLWRVLVCVWQLH